MKHTALLSLGFALLSHSVQADQKPVSTCVEALEQLETLQTVAPVFKLAGGQERQYLADADRPAEVSRLKTIVAGTCSVKHKIRRREQSEAEQLHLVRSPDCMQERDRLSMMEKKDARTPEDDLARTRKRVVARCPDVDLSDVWLVEWKPRTKTSATGAVGPRPAIALPNLTAVELTFTDSGMLERKLKARRSTCIQYWRLWLRMSQQHPC